MLSALLWWIHGFLCLSMSGRVFRGIIVCILRFTHTPRPLVLAATSGTWDGRYSCSNRPYSFSDDSELSVEFSCTIATGAAGSSAAGLSAGEGRAPAAAARGGRAGGGLD